MSKKCARCSNMAEPNRSRCARCLKKLVESTAKTRIKRKSAGLCYKCGKHKARVDRINCEYCARDESIREIERQDERKQNRLCIGCGKLEPRSGLLFCEPCSEKGLISQKKRNHIYKTETMSHYSHEYSDVPMCSWPNCKNTNLYHLTIDHINGGGNKHRKEIGTTNMYAYLRKFGYPPGYQVLCMNHQLEKKIRNGEGRKKK